MRTSLARELHEVGVDEIDRLATLAFDAAHHHWVAIGDPKRTRPRIITDHGNTGDRRARHLALIVLWPGQPEARRYCADSWCDGRCGMPALVITTPSGDAGATVTLKAHGDHVACGNLMQHFRVAWTGATEEAPPEHHTDLLGRVYF